jgi:hypothetical protein
LTTLTSVNFFKFRTLELGISEDITLSYTLLKSHPKEEEKPTVLLPLLLSRSLPQLSGISHSGTLELYGFLYKVNLAIAHTCPALS